MNTDFRGHDRIHHLRDSATQQIQALQQQYKTEFMAEETVRHFLNHKSFTGRSFDVLQKHLDGFKDDGLRKILTRGRGANFQGRWR